MKKSHVLFPALLCLLFAWVIPFPLRAQLNDDYFRADQLLEQQQYEKAYEKFAKLYQQHPGTYIILEKATECLINLKQYDKAIELVDRALDQGFYRAQATIRLGEIYHIRGDTTRAFEIWDRIPERFGGENIQIYLSLARTL
jgi:tetratricopeptide (TPR) repeat protein